MRRTLALAERARGETSPNPMVGCVLVKDGQVIAEGYHRRAGEPHAEIEALRVAREAAAGADVYVNLEPCNHFGRTGPCAAALIEAKVRRVVVGMIDPNPRVSGAGIAALRAAGIEVEVGLLQHEAERLNEAFSHYIVQKLPFATLKVAETLDGRVATHNGSSRWITGPESRRLVHELRSEVDAILTGVGTVLADDPELTVREAERRRGEQGPLRVVVDSRLRTPPSARMLREPGPKVILATTQAAPERAAPLLAAGAEIWELGAGEGGQVDLLALYRRLGERGLTHLLAEAGPRLNGALLDAGLVDRVFVFIAPKILGAGDALPAFAGRSRERIDLATRLRGVKVRRVGGDILLRGYIDRG